MLTDTNTKGGKWWWPQRSWSDIEIMRDQDTSTGQALEIIL